jgi:predicted DsbA family dithiol-disulfide isomerase
VTELLEEAVRGTEVRAKGDTRSMAAAPTTASTKLTIEVISDAICPWCWVGKRRLDRALVALSPEISATVTWRPFELNPEMPKAGLDRRAYRSRKFGSWERSQALDAQVAAAAKADGLDFRHDRMERTPNTVDAHRLIWLAGCEGKQDAVVEGLFSAYFHEGGDVGASDVLVAVGSAAGLNPARVSAMLASGEGLNEVAAELDRAGRLRVSGVPTVVVNGRPLFSGAIRSELIESHLREAVASLRAAAHRNRGGSIGA